MPYSRPSVDSILLLDDDQPFRQSAAQALLAIGCRIIEAQNAAVASTKIFKGAPTLAIVNFRLPEITGPEWIKQMRCAGITIPMIISTDEDLDEFSLQRLYREINIASMIRKPIDPADFTRQIQDLLTTRSKSPTRLCSSRGREPASIPPDFEFELSPARAEYLKDTPEDTLLEPL